jgi:proline iminopeptidase
MTQFRWWLAPMLLAGCASEPGWIDDRFFVRVDDADLYVHAVGDGTANKFVLFLHGGPGGGASQYELAPSAPTLHENLVMIYLDQRGAGASEGRTAPEDLTLPMLTNDILAVMDVIELLYLADRTGNPELWLMGHSWGGLLGPSVLFETDAPERLAGWIEVNGAHDIPKLHADSKAMLLDAAAARLDGNLDDDQREGWQEVERVAKAAPEVPKTIDDLLELNRVAAEATGLVDEVEFQDPDAATTMSWLMQKPTSFATNQTAQWKVATALLEKELETSWTDQYRTLDLPTLLISGTYDYVVPPSLNTEVELSIAAERVELVEFAESAHMPMFSEPDAYAATVLEFVGSAQ